MRRTMARHLISHWIHFSKVLEMSAQVQRILGGIYLLSIDPINEGVNFKENYKITAVLSVVHGGLPPYLAQQYEHLQIDVNDEETVNLLEHFPEAMSFMDKALFTGHDGSQKHLGAVLVHCAQGQSRSVAIILAYLMYKYKLSVEQAIHAIKRKSPAAQPNDGFVEQLQLYKEMGCEVLQNSKVYRSFLIANSLKLDPSGGLLRQQGLWLSHETGSKSGEASKNDSVFNLRCKRCRTVLAMETEIEKHERPVMNSRQAQFIKTAPNSRRIISAVDASKTCSHYFVDEPLTWMTSELSKQDMEGKLSCPKCEAKVGGYSWKGSRCSCGKWMIPAIHLQTAKVDCMKRN